MKTKTLAFSLMLTFTSCALFASPSRDTIPTQKDSIPGRDTIPKRDSTTSFANANENLTVYNFSNFANRRDTVPSPKDTIPKKDSTVAFSKNALGNVTAYNFSNFASIDTVPAPKDTIPKKDSLALNSIVNFNAKLNVPWYISVIKHPQKDEMVYAILPATEKYKV